MYAYNSNYKNESKIKLCNTGELFTLVLQDYFMSYNMLYF